MILEDRIKKFLKSSVYPVITPEFCGNRTPKEVLEMVLLGGAKIVQLREKEFPEKYAENFRKITNEHGALLIINDFVDIALKYGADGVHIGQEDLSLKETRAKAPDLVIGVSVNTKDEAIFAQENGASYVNLGVAFPTKTKTDIKLVTGIAFIKEVSPLLKIPYTVIGGIKKENIEELLKIGARHIAIATAITEAIDPKEETRYFIKKIRDHN